jgi:hypothetical protein
MAQERDGDGWSMRYGCGAVRSGAVLCVLVRWFAVRNKASEQDEQDELSERAEVRA